MTARRIHTLAFGVALLWVAGCEDEVINTYSADQKPTAARSAAAEQAQGTAPSDEPGPPAVEFQEADFAESDRSRDPFRSFAQLFAEEAKGRVRSQRQVLLDQYSVDELKLVGIVSRIVPARAMLVDPTGKGHVIQRGQFVGRPEIVQGGTSGADYEINWRVERIRDGDIVLVREDPANPDVPSATRVIPLRAEEKG